MQKLPSGPSASTTDLPPTVQPRSGQDVSRLRDLSPQQWKSGIAAWLGWLFDGLDMHLYTLVAAPFVGSLLRIEELPAEQQSILIGRYSSLIQAAFLLGWALGGGFFGRIGDRLGRSRALVLTILTYATFTGLSYFAQTWWQLMLFRFLAALGIGGEWAVGASLLSETWPRRWRPWIAAVLQSGVNIGVILACLAGYLLAARPYREVFLVGILPALLVLWIRRAVPEPEEWHAAKLKSRHVQPGILDLFRGPVRRTTILTILVCATALTAHWAFMFWYSQHLRTLSDLSEWSKEEKTQLVSAALLLVMAMSIAGNFVGAVLARWIGYRNAIAAMCLAYFFAMLATYSVPRGYVSLLWCLPAMGITQGVFALFTMYMPPLFPTLLRTTGAGFCYNIGRIAAAVGTIFFGLLADPEVRGWLQDHAVRESIVALIPTKVDYRYALLYSSFLFLPAALIALFLPEPKDEQTCLDPVE